jgi:hypothetical protein
MLREPVCAVFYPFLGPPMSTADSRSSGDPKNEKFTRKRVDPVASAARDCRYGYWRVLGRVSMPWKKINECCFRIMGAADAAKSNGVTIQTKIEIASYSGSRTLLPQVIWLLVIVYEL